MILPYKCLCGSQAVAPLFDMHPASAICVCQSCGKAGPETVEISGAIEAWNKMISDETKAKVRSVLRTMHPSNKWAAMDKDGTWYAFGDRPSHHPADTYWYNGIDCEEIIELFDYPFPGDWRDSLVERE